jgi:hypothetical protein
MKSGETGEKLNAMIKKAIDDGKITNIEYERILAVAEADHVIDSQEKRLLAQLQDMLSNKTIVRVPDWSSFMTLIFLAASDQVHQPASRKVLHIIFAAPLMEGCSVEAGKASQAQRLPDFLLPKPYDNFFPDYDSWECTPWSQAFDLIQHFGLIRFRQQIHISEFIFNSAIAEKPLARFTVTAGAQRIKLACFHHTLLLIIAGHDPRKRRYHYRHSKIFCNTLDPRSPQKRRVRIPPQKDPFRGSSI